MSVAEINEAKSNLIAWIEQLSDADMLTFLDGLRASKPTGDWWDDLSESQKRELNEGIDDAENGRVISSEEFWKNLRNG
jgi:RNA polymerase-binding transcription factor DksA